MSLIIVILVFLLAYGILWLTTKTLMLAANLLQQREQEVQRLHQTLESMADTTEQIRDASVPHVSQEDPIENLLKANQEIQRRINLKEAAKKELGVDI